MDLSGTSVSHTHLLHCRSGSGDLDGRFYYRLEGSHTRSGSVGGVVTNEVTASHQPVGGESNNDLTTRLVSSNCTLVYRQSTGSIRHQQDEVQVPFTDGRCSFTCSLLKILLTRQLEIKAFRISSHFNSRADAPAVATQSPAVATDRIDDPTSIVLGIVQLEGGQYQIDIMASRENTQLPLLYSCLQDKAALGHNALTQDWSRWRAIYFFPPLWLIPRTMQKLRSYNGQGIMIVPWTPAEH